MKTPAFKCDARSQIKPSRSYSIAWHRSFKTGNLRYLHSKVYARVQFSAMTVRTGKIPALKQGNVTNIALYAAS